MAPPARITASRSQSGTMTTPSSSGRNSARVEPAGFSPKARCGGTTSSPRTRARIALPVAASSPASTSPRTMPIPASRLKRRRSSSDAAVTAPAADRARAT